jgi:hypothetical protein
LYSNQKINFISHFNQNSLGIAIHIQITIHLNFMIDFKLFNFVNSIIIVEYEYAAMITRVFCFMFVVNFADINFDMENVLAV